MTRFFNNTTTAIEEQVYGVASGGGDAVVETELQQALDNLKDGASNDFDTLKELEDSVKTIGNHDYLSDFLSGLL